MFVGPLRATCASCTLTRIQHNPTTTEDWYISVATLVKGFDADPYFRMAEQEAWLPHGGKPHWGKVHYLGHNELRQLYGGPFDTFLAVRRRLDPNNVFVNEHLLTLFFPKASK